MALTTLLPIIRRTLIRKVNCLALVLKLRLNEDRDAPRSQSPISLAMVLSPASLRSALSSQRYIRRLGIWHVELDLVELAVAFSWGICTVCV